MRDVQARIEQALRQMPHFEAIRNNVVVSVTGEGLRIDLLETEQGMFFVSGDPTPTGAGVRLLKTLAAQLSRKPPSLVIEGHTDALPFRKSTPSSGYGNWDLAADRGQYCAAAAARLRRSVRPNGRNARVRPTAGSSSPGTPTIPATGACR